MQELHSFEYAVIRVVPKVDREEFLNVGVMLYCPKQKFMELAWTLDAKRLHAFSPGLDLVAIEEHLNAFGKIVRAAGDGGPIATLDIASRFRWLTATRSTVLQTSRVHPGLTANPELTMQKLFNDLVEFDHDIS